MPRGQDSQIWITFRAEELSSTVQILQKRKDQSLRKSQNNPGLPEIVSTTCVELTVLRSQGQGKMPDGTSRFKCKGKGSSLFWPKKAIDADEEFRATSLHGMLYLQSIYRCQQVLSRQDQRASPTMRYL